MLFKSNEDSQMSKAACSSSSEGEANSPLLPQKKSPFARS